MDILKNAMTAIGVLTTMLVFIWAMDKFLMWTFWLRHDAKMWRDHVKRK